MRTLIAVLSLAALLFCVTTSPNNAQAGAQKRWTLGPPSCVNVRFLRSRQTRYAGAPRCRRIYV